ncbi:hypothetical protein GWC95_04010 [Sediminibacterium roseum]|uniref:CDP-Glycerol:Poly(Glycerophosphate) glycerophosphotransferase n=1 Tax=Sediminibacterium roseum TaxID=1978412 RepID=A0ABW9ZV28_9BACT|nr:hypothetical protein [Sediminibacterium roseum]NCI49073.1 hypothetical protein [Sediminibacterium roseum]
MSKLKGRGLFVFSDPGGAKPLLALINQLSGILEDHRVVSDREYSFFNEFGIVVSRPDMISDFDEFKPEFVFTGTSYTSDIELVYIKEAADRKIPCYSFVDHWSEILQRFKKDDVFCMPDKILVIDQAAKELALNEGIESERLEIFGNPYHLFLKNWEPIIDRKSFFGSYNIDPNDFVITFAPDPLSNAGGALRFGTDEKEIASIFIKALENISTDKKITVIVKLHPNQNYDYLVSAFDDTSIPSVCLKEVDTRYLLYFSDIVVGIFSNILAEASIFGKKIIRILINCLIDPLEVQNIGQVCTTKEQLEKNLHNNLQ